MAIKTQRDMLRELLETGKNISKEEALEKANIKKVAILYEHIAKLRLAGYIIKTHKGTYTMLGYDKPTLKSKEDYVEARSKLMPEAENYADRYEERNTESWSRVFARKMDELATEYLGCKASWQM